MRFTAYYSRTTARGHVGWNWTLTCDRTGLDVTHGWTAGPKRDAAADVAQCLRKLGGSL